MKKIITLFLLLFTAFSMLAANITLYYVDESGWGNIHAYAWKNSTQANLGSWPGTQATLESKTMGGKNVYSYTFESTAADRIIFNNGGYGEQTEDLTINTSKPYYYNNTWNTSITYDASATTYCMAGTASVSGTDWCCGQEWTPSGCELTDGSISFSALPAGEYKFKITNGTWNSSWGYSALTSKTGCTEDTNGNVVITLTQTSDIKIDFNSSTKKITVAITAVSTPVDPDDTRPTGEVKISAIRDRLSINTNDFTDFAGLYVSELPKAGDATVSYEWQYSSNGNSWAKYSDGDGATWDNIRPNKAGYYRCVISYDLAGEITNITSNTLQITNKGGNSVSFSSNLPVILVRTAKDFPVHNIDTQGYPNIEQVEALKAKRSVDVKILWNEEGGSVTNADINNADMLHYDRKARMNYRGSSSLYNSKKSYAFVSGDKNCDPKKLGEVKTKKFGMFGAAAQKDWVLYASAPDATYMRNILTYHQYSQMTGLWGAKCRYVELYIDGSYQGIYVFMDKITQDENRVNVNEDTGYIVKFDKTDIADRYAGKQGANEDYKRNTFTTSYTGRTGISTYNITVDQAFEIAYPEREDIAEFDDDGNVTNDAPWEAKVAEIKGIFENMEKAILANDYAKLATIIDYDSWADYFIMNEFSRNADAYRISCVFTINSTSDKIVANPMWDYELGWGNQDTQTNGLMVEDVKYYSDDFPTPFWWTGKGKSGCNGILGDCKFRAKVLERWEKYIGTNGALNSTVLTAKIDSLQAALSGSSTKTSVNTSSLKSWVTNRTSGLNTEFNTWDACPDLKFALVGTINDEELSTYANGIQLTEQEDGSYTATFTASEAEHSLQIITSTGDIWARDNSKNIVSTDEDASSYASMTKGQTTGYANITTVANTEYSFTFKLNGDGVSGKLTYLKGKSVLPDPYVVTPTITNLKCYNDYDGAISLEVSGSVAPYTYTWTYPDGTEVAAKDISGLRAGVYSLKIEDSIGLTYEATYEVTQPTDVVDSLVGSTMVPYCNANGELTAELTGGVAPYTYKWTDGGVDNVLGTEQTLTNLAGGVYYLYAYDANGCLGYVKSVINETEPLDITATTTNVKCYASNEGKIDIQVTGGTAPYTYSWKSEGFESSFEDIENLKAGVYTVTVLDANGCSLDKEISVTEPEKLVSELISGGKIPYCKSIGELTFDVKGGVAPYTYELHKGSIDGEIVSTEITATNLAADAYYAYVYDANGCRDYTKQIIESTEELKLKIETVNNPSEYFAKDGSIDITVTGGLEPYTYEWRGTDFNSSSEDVSELGADIYKIIVTDANDCLVNDAIELTQPTPKPFVVNPTIKNLKCYNDYDGAISIEVSGSVAPYTYTWTYPNGTKVNTKDISGLRAGVYSLKIEDSVGLIYEATYEVTQPTDVVASIVGSTMVPYCNANGELTAELTGGVAPYTYKWTDGGVDNVLGTDQTLTNLGAGAYYLYAYDSNGCLGYVKTMINETEPIEIEIASITHVDVRGESTGAIEIDVTGGAEPYNYEWEGPGIVNSMNQNQYQLPAGFYSVVVTDDYGCEESAEYEIKQPDITTDVEDLDTDIKINVSNGLISVSDGDLTIYNVIGQDVTVYNGGLLPGVYMVQIGDKSTKVIMK